MPYKTVSLSVTLKWLNFFSESVYVRLYHLTQSDRIRHDNPCVRGWGVFRGASLALSQGGGIPALHFCDYIVCLYHLS